MASHTSGAARRLSLLLVGIMILAVLAPAGARASTDLTLGGAATVSGAEGGSVLLRAEPGWEAMVLTSVPEGTVIDVLDGPITAPDGSLWYAVVALGQEGFLPADFLNNPDAAITGDVSAAVEDTASAEGEAVDGESEFPAAAENTAIIAGTNNDGARCRTEPTYAAEVITVLLEGEAVELTAPAVDEWQSLLCAGVQGYVHSDFVLLPGESPLEPAPVEEIPFEEVPVVEAPAEEVPVEDVPVEEAPVAEAPVEEAPMDEAPLNEAPVEETVAVESDPTEVVEAPEAEATEVIEAPAVEETQVVEETPIVGETAAPEVMEPIVTEPVVTETPEPEATEAPTEEATADPIQVPVAEPAPTEAVTPEIVVANAAAVQETFMAAVEPTATGYSLVVGTNGDGVRCRSAASFEASTITVLSEGSEVALRGAASGVWQPIVCAGMDGFAHTDYLGASDGSGDVKAAVGSDAQFTASAASGSAVVSGTGGGGLRCRSTAGYNGSVITVLAEGTKVSLNGGMQGEWQPVICAGMSGFAHGDFLTASASNGGVSGGGSTSGGVGSTGSAKVSGTNGDGVRCRSSAGYNGSIITVLAEGASVSVRRADQGEWTPVTCAGMSGFVHMDFLTMGGGSTSGGGNTSGGGSSSGGATTGTMTVSGTGGGGLRCRSSANMNGGIIVVLSEGASVATRGSASGGWQPVVCAGQNGFASTDYLTAGGSTNGGGTTGGGSTSGGGATSGGGGSDMVGSRMMTMASLNLRYDSSMSAGVAAVAPSGTVVKVTGQRNGFMAVDWDGLKGWMYADYLAATDQPLSERGGSGTPTAPTNPDGGNAAPGSGSGTSNGGGSTATGTSIANFGMQYVGYPYVWAGEGPYGFDCSGFVMFVIKQTLGLSITHDMFVQYDLGAPVSRDALQPGDIVFFQNTFRWGMSHNGVYIGNGQFVHAENESTGVRVSDINSQYYSSRYYGAVRFT